MDDKINELFKSLSAEQRKKFFETFSNDAQLQEDRNRNSVKRKYSENIEEIKSTNICDVTCSIVSETILSASEGYSLSNENLGITNESQNINVLGSKNTSRRLSRRTLNFVAIDTQETQDDVISETTFLENTEEASTTESVESEISITKESFLRNLTQFFKSYDPALEVKDNFIVGLFTERSRNGIWVLKENQSLFFNPLGRFFTKKRGPGYQTENKITTYWCKNCRKSPDSNWLYGNALVELKLKNKNILSVSGTHHSNCKEICFKEMMANEFFLYTTALVRNPAMKTNVSFILGEEKLQLFAKTFKFGLGELKTYFGEYHQRGGTLRSASYRNAPKLKDGRFPDILRTVSEMEDNKEPLKFHVLGEPKDDLIVFATQKGLQIYNDSKIRMSDGTFFVCPSEYAQLYVVIAVLEEIKNNEKRIEFLPVAFGIMKNRTEIMYKKFWDVLLKEMQLYAIEHTQPSMFITDKERAMINVIDKLYPEKHVHCFFHQCQSIVRNLQNMGLVKYLMRLRRGADNQQHLAKFYEIFRKIIALPMLPEQFITPQYFRLQDELIFSCEQWMTVSEMQHLKKWTEYLKNEWYNVSESEFKKISKFKKSIRNTNGSETLNKKINTHPYTKKHGSCINTMILCQKLEEDMRLKKYNLVRFKNTNTFAFRKRNPKTVERESKIEDMQKKFEDRNFEDANTYLEEMANLLMPLKFKEIFEEITKLMEIPASALEQNDENINEDLRGIIENAFNVSTNEIIGDIGHEEETRISTYSGRTVRFNRRYYNLDYVNY